MKYLIKIISAITLFTISLSAQEERKVLVEVFTNSHCPLCPAAHNVIDNYLASPNSDKISYIYYHMVYSYPDDLLYQQSMEGSDARDNYYNPVSATPQGWFDGTHQGSTSGWAASLDNLVNTQSPLKINLGGTRDPDNFYINAELTRTGNIPDNDLVIHFVVAEDLFYDGRNSVSDHKHVMRKMFPSPVGQSFSINLNETKNIPQTIPLDPIWDADSLNIVVFVQSAGSMTVYQSETINYDELNVSEVDDKKLSLKNFNLEQNYPNPFNPSTKIRWSSPISAHQTLKIYNLLGNEVATLIDEYMSADNHEIIFNASALPSGIYFYTLQVGNFKESKKMTVLK